MFDDIPEARREQTPPQKELRASRSGLFWGLGVLGILLLGAGFWLIPRLLNPFAVSGPPVARAPSSTVPSSSPPTPAPSASSVDTSDIKASPSPVATENNDTLLGHLSYAEAPQAELRPISADGQLKLRAAAAEKFNAMVAAAKADGVYLQPLSAFRSVDDQNYLFFDVKAQRGEVTTERARVSAPPGHSEHHTGYAIDIGDPTQPNAHLQINFDQTSAFTWLRDNAARYSFELSFPENNSQGVSYEPWHWRFVGDRQSLETFYRARQLKSGQ
jgi:zinc D-Ala-D-Ala carboxypeptidase